MNKGKFNFKKVLKPLLIVIAIIAVLFIIYVIRNFVIISNLQKVSEETEKHSNYTVETLQTNKADVQQMKVYFKDGTYYSEVQSSSIGEEDIIVKIYRTEDERFLISENGKTVIPFSEDMHYGTSNIWTYHNEIRNTSTLKNVLTQKITSEECYGVDCYKIEYDDDYILWFEKDTGLLRLELNSKNLIYWEYEFDTVNDLDVARPDTEGYTIVDNMDEN